MYFVKTILSILGFVIPFILIVFTTIDIYKGIINPDNKDIVKKIIMWYVIISKTLST